MSDRIDERGEPAAADSLSPGRPLGRVLRVAVAAAGAGAIAGALGLGTIVALLQVLHDPTATARDAAVLTLWCFLLYGVAGACASGVAATTAAMLRPRSATSRLVLFGVGCFLAACFAVVAVYGFTYGQLPTPALAHRWGMVLWLGVRVLVAVALAVAITAAAGVAIGRWRPDRRPALALLFSAFAVALLGVAASGALIAPRQRPTPPPPDLETTSGGRPVVLLAFDGADWQVLETLIERGEMPHLAGLIARGTRASLATLPDANSAVIWASIYSGQPPPVHGIHDFYRLRFAGMRHGLYPAHQTGLKELARRLQPFGLAELRPIDRTDVAAPLLWEVAARAGRSVGVVDGYYYSYPAPDLGDANRFYFAYGSDGWARSHRRRAAALAEAPEASAYVRPPALMSVLADTVVLPDLAWQSETLLRLLESGEQPDLVSLYSHQPDGVQHWEWRDFEPELYFRGGRGEQKIARIHRQIDAFLGRLLPLLDPRTVVVLASDHGHSPTIVHAMDTQHRHGPPGVLVMAGPGIVPGKLAEAHVYDLMPTLLTLLGLPVAADLPGRILDAALGPEIADNGMIDSLQGLPMPPLADGPRDADRQAEELEKLKALGYIR